MLKGKRYIVYCNVFFNIDKYLLFCEVDMTTKSKTDTELSCFFFCYIP